MPAYYLRKITYWRHWCTLCHNIVWRWHNHKKD